MQVNIGDILKHRAEAVAVAEEEFTKFCASWTTSSWDEIDWLYRIKEVQLRDLLEARNKQLLIAQEMQCMKCPNFVKHV